MDELSCSSCTPKAVSATSVTPETSTLYGGQTLFPRGVVDTAAVADRAALALLHQRQRALVRLTFHGWCAAHSNTKILRNMSGMAALMRRQPTPTPQEQPTGAMQASASALAATNARLARLEEELAGVDQERDEAVAKAVAEAQGEAQAALKTALDTASRVAAARETELASRISVLEGQLGALNNAVRDERRRNAAVLQELARSLSATHGRTLAVLESTAASQHAVAMRSSHDTPGVVEGLTSAIPSLRSSCSA